MYIEGSGSWKEEERLEQLIRADRPNLLTIEGTSLSGTGWAFTFGAEVGDSGVLTGERISPDGSAKYEYSFARRGGRITGVLKRYRREESGAFLPSPDEWVFEADRK